MSFSIKQKNKNFTKGFTLVEIMVATSIFMMIMLIALGALIISSNASKKAQATRSSMDNVSFAMESMARSLRGGTNYTCVTSSVSLPDSLPNADCLLNGSGGGAIAFTPALAPPRDPRTVAYQLTQRSDLTYTLQKCTSIPTSSCLDIVSPEINIDYLKFFVRGSSRSDKIQPSIYILIKGTAMVKNEPTVFAIQTNVSQRSAE